MPISNEFVKIARVNAQQAGVEVDFRQGNASEIPLRDQTFDFTFCSWSFKNFKKPLNVLNEMYRALKPGATALIIDLNRDAPNLEWNKYASNSGLKGVAALFMKTAFRIQRSGAYSKSEFSELIQKTHFERYDIQAVGINLYVYLFK
ncbi:MAG: class I SAM-dependent methyltransferase [Gammaproteobacteria bacterium]|nr:class I SAM-dependent methyltransferase [Gammaproteobacteria bacterium]